MFLGSLSSTARHTLLFLPRPESLCWGALPSAEAIILLDMQIPLGGGTLQLRHPLHLKGGIFQTWEDTGALGRCQPLLRRTKLFLAWVGWNSGGDGWHELKGPGESASGEGLRRETGPTQGSPLVWLPVGAELFC